MNETIENNKLIAEFMGLAKQHQTNDNKYPVFESPESGEYIEPESLKYDESWDWLMPVVEKIMDEGYQFSFGSSRIGYRVGKNTWLADGDLSKGRKTATFEATVFMIKNILNHETNKTKIRSKV